MFRNLLLDSFFDFDRDFYNFSRSEKDMSPYSIIEKKDERKTILVHNILGINKEDLKVTVKTENNSKVLYISGETLDKITGQHYSINSRFKLGNTKDVEDISSECKNGLLYIEILHKEPQKQIEEPKEERIEIK